jgi:hypothetical protein
MNSHLATVMNDYNIYGCLDRLLYSQSIVTDL